MSWIPSLSSLSNSVSNWVEGAVDRVSLVTLVYPVAAPELGASGPGGSAHDDPAVAVAATWATANDDDDDDDADFDRDRGSSDGGGDLGDLEDPLGAQACGGGGGSAAAATQRVRRRREPYPEAVLPTALAGLEPAPEPEPELGSAAPMAPPPLSAGAGKGGGEGKMVARGLRSMDIISVRHYTAGTAVIVMVNGAEIIQTQDYGMGDLELEFKFTSVAGCGRQGTLRIAETGVLKYTYKLTVDGRHIPNEPARNPVYGTLALAVARATAPCTTPGLCHRLA